MDQVEGWMEGLTGGDATTQLALYALLIVLAIVVFNYVLRRVLVRFGNSARHTNTFWELALVSAARRPLSVLAWVVGIAFLGQIVEAQTKTVLTIIHPLRVIGVITCLGWFVANFVAKAKDAIIHRRTARGETTDRTTADAIAQLLRIAVWITTFLVILQSLGFSVQGVLAFGGIGGIAIGFAAKDLLANFFGSLMIYFDRPFAVGDWVRSPEKQIEGTVEDIGWRLTRIRTPEKRPLYVPNSVFATITVENPSRMSHRRIDETVGVRYDDIGEVPGIVDDIRNMLSAHPEIDTSLSVIVNFNKFNDSSLDILIRAFSLTTAGVAFQQLKQDILLKVADIIARHGAEIAFPTRVNLIQSLPVAPGKPPAEENVFA